MPEQLCRDQVNATGKHGVVDKSIDGAVAMKTQVKHRTRIGNPFAVEYGKSTEVEANQEPVKNSVPETSDLWVGGGQAINLRVGKWRARG